MLCSWGKISETIKIKMDLKYYLNFRSYTFPLSERKYN